ncbi:MAG TPA: putative Ig domain-containing protein [Verrucomicrobiae bacterium]|nr:putative Ig domain-containing protein [Verrucomicrobiae bacterium]
MKTLAKNPILLIALIISLDFMLAGRAAADGVYHFIYGYVRDSVGNPVVGLDVVGDDYVGDVFPAVTTDMDGYYLFDAGIEGNYRVTLDCSELTAFGFQCLDPFAVTVSGEYNQVDFTVSVAVSAPPLQIITASLPNGNVTMPYSAQLGAMNGQPPYTWQLASNSPSLPAGLSLTSSGLISGTPKTNSVFAFKAQVTDGNSAVTNKVLFITVNRRPMLLTPAWLTNRFSMRLFGAANQNYTIQTSTNLYSTNWVSLFTTNNPNASSYMVTDPQATNRQRFYRVLIGP